MFGSSRETLRMFKSLCGKTAMKNTILATTFWDQVQQNVGTFRELELKSNREFWGQLIEQGAHTERYTRDRGLGLLMIERIASFNVKITLQAQDEMTNLGLNAGETSAAGALNSGLMEEQRRQEERLRKERLDARKSIKRKNREVEERLQEQIRAAAAAAEMERLQREQHLAEEAETRRQAEDRHRSYLDELQRRQEQLAAQEREIEEQRQAEIRQHEEALRALQKQSYRQYVCKRMPIGGKRCDRCRRNLHAGYEVYFR